MRTLRIGRVRLRIPDEVEVRTELDLDTIYGSSEKHPDALIVVSREGETYAIVIEDTGIPEPKDLERLVNASEDLKTRGFVPTRAIVVRLLHHKGGVATLLKNMARSYRVELQRCGESVDLGEVLMKIMRRLGRSSTNQ